MKYSPASVRVGKVGMYHAPHYFCLCAKKAVSRLRTRDRNRWMMLPTCIWWTIWREENSRCFANSGNTVQISNLIVFCFWCNLLRRDYIILDTLGSCQDGRLVLLSFAHTLGSCQDDRLVLLSFTHLYIRFQDNPCTGLCLIHTTAAFSKKGVLYH